MVVGGGAADGVATTTSLLTATTISIAIQTLVAVTATTSVGGIAPRLSRFAAEEMLAIGGSIIRNIAAELRIKTVRPQTGLVAQRAVIRLPTARPVPGNRLAVRVAI